MRGERQLAGMGEAAASSVTSLGKLATMAVLTLFNALQKASWMPGRPPDFIEQPGLKKILVREQRSGAQQWRKWTAERVTCGCRQALLTLLCYIPWWSACRGALRNT